jgi:hypothetical protein
VPRLLRVAPVLQALENLHHIGQLPYVHRSPKRQKATQNKGLWNRGIASA